jgi:hypothetical protein
MRGSTARLGKEGRSAPSVASSQGKGVSPPIASHDEGRSCPYDPDQPCADWMPSALAR